ncbi:hypothetical protein F4604DRAFT_1680686 [Suillus subluteus]|nr:hypothetical protein F4604DRAFT_1680686 [Suillus subluteus]
MGVSSLFQPKLKRKRGEHTSRMTLSCKWIEDTFGAAEQTATYKSKKGADHTQRTLVDEDRAANTSWAKAVFSAFGMAADFSCVPSLPKCWQTQMPVQHDEESFAVRMRRVECNVLSVRDDIYNIKGNINNVTAHVMDLKSLVRNEHCPTLSTPAPSVDHPSPHHNQAPILVHAAQLEVQVSTLMPSSGQSDIDRLCKEWESSNLLCVGGRGIPVKYWGEFYKRGKGVKNTAWDALRVEWGNWKDQRISAAAQDANDARTFFDGNLDHPLAQGAFRYTKGGKSYVSSKDDCHRQRSGVNFY